MKGLQLILNPFLLRIAATPKRLDYEGNIYFEKSKDFLSTKRHLNLS